MARLDTLTTPPILPNNRFATNLIIPRFSWFLLICLDLDLLRSLAEPLYILNREPTVGQVPGTHSLLGITIIQMSLHGFCDCVTLDLIL